MAARPAAETPMFADRRPRRGSRRSRATGRPSWLPSRGRNARAAARVEIDGLGRLPPRTTREHGAVYADHLLNEPSLVQILDSGAAGGALAALEHARERRRQTFGPLVRAQLAPGDTADPLRHVAHRDRNDGEVAGEGLLHGVGRRSE